MYFEQQLKVSQTATHPSHDQALGTDSFGGQCQHAYRVAHLRAVQTIGKAVVRTYTLLMLSFGCLLSVTRARLTYNVIKGTLLLALQCDGWTAQFNTAQSSAFHGAEPNMCSAHLLTVQRRFMVEHQNVAVRCNHRSASKAVLYSVVCSRCLSAPLP